MKQDQQDLNSWPDAENEKHRLFETDSCKAVKAAHAVTIITEWDEFKTYDRQQIFNLMAKPAFVFDGRNILDHQKLSEIGFEVKGIMKGHID